MEWKSKDYLRLTIIGAVIILTISTAVYVYAYSRSTQPASAFSVTAEGKSVAIPDTAKFTFTVLTEGGNDPIKLQKENTAKMNAIVKYLKEQGIAEKDIKTEGYYLNPQYSYTPCREGATCSPPKIKSYSISQTTSVKTQDFTKAGELLAGVVSKGANQVSGIELTMDDKTAIENEARMEAMKKATEKARAIAKAGGFRLGRLLSVDEYAPGGPIPMYGGIGGGGEISVMPKALPAPDIQPGSQEFIVNVTLRYEIR